LFIVLGASPEDMVDAALAGLDQGETVAIPSLPDKAEWDEFDAARAARCPANSRARFLPVVTTSGNPQPVEGRSV